DDSSHDEESSPCRLRQAPKGVPEDSHREARSGLSVISPAGWVRNRVARSREKGVRIALGQELDRTLLDLGTDEDELGVQLPRLELVICGRLRFGKKAFLGLKGRPL